MDRVINSQDAMADLPELLALPSWPMLYPEEVKREED
jgi:hypothetical protein